MIDAIQPGQVGVWGFVVTIIVGAALFATGLAWWRGLPRSFRPRYGTVPGAAPVPAMCLGVGFVFGSARYLTAGPVGDIGGVIFVVLDLAGLTYMVAYGLLGVPNGLRPRPQRGMPGPPLAHPRGRGG